MHWGDNICSVTDRKIPHRHYKFSLSKESYYNLIEESNFLEEIVTNQNNLDSVEAVSGATYTSDYLKELIEKIKIYDRSK